jgi:protein SCO1/2
MGDNPGVPVRRETTGFLDWGLRLSLGVTLLCGALGLVLALGGSGSPAASPPPFLVASPRPAPPIALTGPTGQPVTLASYRGGPVLVFFGYTHCPDVCPATVGTMVAVINAGGPPVRAIFVTIDPERDTPAALAEYVRFLPAAFTALTGSAVEIHRVADSWGVRYARVETGPPGSYSMSHMANVYLVDAAGLLRATFPFGTSSNDMLTALRGAASGLPVTASAVPIATAPLAASPSAAALATGMPTVPPTAAGVLRAEVVSSSIWAGGSSPVILSLWGSSGRIDEVNLAVAVQLATASGVPTGDPVAAIAVQPPGETSVFYVATLGVPSPGWWRLIVSSEAGAAAADLAALDPGTTAPIGSPAPAIRTPTLDDVGGDARQITTDPAPDLRLSRTSTVDALASHTPFVLVVDSPRFRTTSACGKAVVLARYLADRWPSVAFIHLEPFEYSIVTDTPVIDGSLADPRLTAPTAAWGIGGSPWGALSMPWVFVVDGNGIVRATYEGVMGSDDVDVILSLIAARG